MGEFRWDESDDDMTVSELIAMLEELPKDAKVFMPDVGCGCCSYYTGIAVRKTDRIFVFDENRVGLFLEEAPAVENITPQTVFVKINLEDDSLLDYDVVSEIQQAISDELRKRGW